MPSFLAGDLSPDGRTRFEQHLVACRACQVQVEAAMQLYALGMQLSWRPERPRAPPEPEPVVRRPAAAPHRRRRRLLGAASLSIAALAIVMLVGRGRTVEDDLVAELSENRTNLERVPYAALDRHREHDAMRAGPARGGKLPVQMRARGAVDAVRGEAISHGALARLNGRPDRVALTAALLARGDVDAAAEVLSRAGRGDDLDVERAIVAQRNAQYTTALTLLDDVLQRAPHHPQALWNRALVLSDLGLPNVAAEAFDACAALAEPGWSTEAAGRRDELRAREAERTRALRTAIAACNRLRDGAIPDLDLVRRSASVCRPGLHQAVREAGTRDDVLRLLPTARAIDDASGDTASSDLVRRSAAADFAIRGPAVAAYRKLTATPALPAADRAALVAQLRASRQSDLVLGALLRDHAQPEQLDELVRIARASGDPFLDELATEYSAKARQMNGMALEAEAILREATRQCAKRDVELRCSYLQLTLLDLYMARHLPSEAMETALAALERTRRLDLYWPERLLFDHIAKAARFARDYAQMRAYAREGELRDRECPQQRWTRELLSDVELAELAFPAARAELDRSPTCGEPLTLERAEIEAELAQVDGGPQRTAALRDQLARMRRDSPLTAGERAQLDAIEGRLLAAGDPAGARPLLRQAIEAADSLGIDDVMGTKARRYAYRTLLWLGAADLAGPALLALFDAAVRAPPRTGCALGAMLDGERVLLLARDDRGEFAQVLEPHAFQRPDFDARTFVPAGLVKRLSHCARVDVIALPPLYGQPRLLPPELAWSYRGPAGAPAPADTPVALTVEDTRPPAALKLPRLQAPSHEPRGTQVDEIVLSGEQATPARVARELASSDLVEFHAHGFVDLGISDVSLVALSPDADGNFALTARTIAGLKLARAPFITLATCHAAYTAPYLHEPWSLPYAFLLAGARGVLAPATEIPDRDAGAFFRAVGDPILRGVDPAAVLRDQRLRWRGRSATWVDDVVLFD